MARPYGQGACGNAAPCVDYLNVSSFALPATGAFGNVGKGLLRGPQPHERGTQASRRIFLCASACRCNYARNFFNFFNRANFNNPNSSASAGGFGSIRGAADPRIGQLALKLLF